eukprot:1159081-Pelagomonas_calceolata.AAC.2
MHDVPHSTAPSSLSASKGDSVVHLRCLKGCLDHPPKVLQKVLASSSISASQCAWKGDCIINLRECVLQLPNVPQKVIASSTSGVAWISLPRCLRRVLEKVVA